MKIKYYPEEGGLLWESNLHLFEGENSSYWAIPRKDYSWIYRLYSKNWEVLRFQHIRDGFIDELYDSFYDKREFIFLSEYREALKIYEKYLSLL